MNAVDAVLHDDLGRLMDRLAATVPGGSLEVASATNPTLRTRLDDMEISLATTRAALLEDYGRWRRVLDDLENLWALAAWGFGGPESRGPHVQATSAAAEKPAEHATPRAA
jgi:hypothetical protein